MYKSLQACRGVAAMMVVLYHLGGAISADKYFGIKGFSVPFSFGGAGVEFFFVLSGFIILTAHRSDVFKSQNLLSYIKKRLIRVYPVYWFVFFPVFIIALFTLIKSLLLIPQDSSLLGGTGAPVLGIAWTLQYEMAFYLFFAFMILSKWLSITLGFGVLLIYLLYSGVSTDVLLFKFLSKDYVLLFFMGMIVAFIHGFREFVVHRPFIFLTVGVLTFFCVSADIILKFNFFHDYKILLYGFSSSLIIFGLVKAESYGKIIGDNYVFQKLGDSSYALYLMHYPMISVLCKLFLFFEFNSVGVLGVFVIYIVIFFICLLSAVAFHLYIEKKVLLKLRKIL